MEKWLKPRPRPKNPLGKTVEKRSFGRDEMWSFYRFIPSCKEFSLGAGNSCPEYRRKTISFVILSPKKECAGSAFHRFHRPVDNSSKGGKAAVYLGVCGVFQKDAHLFHHVGRICFKYILPAPRILAGKQLFQLFPQAPPSVILTDDSSLLEPEGAIMQGMIPCIPVPDGA